MAEPILLVSETEEDLMSAWLTLEPTADDTRISLFLCIHSPMRPPFEHAFTKTTPFSYDLVLDSALGFRYIRYLGTRLQMLARFLP